MLHSDLKPRNASFALWGAAEGCCALHAYLQVSEKQNGNRLASGLCRRAAFSALFMQPVAHFHPCSSSAGVLLARSSAGRLPVVFYNRNSSFPLNESEYHPPGQECLHQSMGHHLPPRDSRFPHYLEELLKSSWGVWAHPGRIKANKSPQTEEKTTFCHCWHTDQKWTISCCSFCLFFTIAAVSSRRERQRAREMASTQGHRCWMQWAGCTATLQPTALKRLRSLAKFGYSLLRVTFNLFYQCCVLKRVQNILVFYLQTMSSMKWKMFARVRTKELSLSIDRGDTWQSQ